MCVKNNEYDDALCKETFHQIFKPWNNKYKKVTTQLFLFLLVK